MNRVEDLEAAIMQRAEKLATEYKERAERRRAAILKDAAEQLRLREEKETATAKAQGELVYLRKVQASELKFKANMDHLRWSLVLEVEQRLEENMQAFNEQEENYLRVLRSYLAQGAQAIEQSELVAQVNSRDHQRLAEHWEAFAAEAAPGKHVTLANDPINTLGGMLISSKDGRVRINNTFEGRRERLRSRLHQIIVERLIPAALDGGSTV
jgi:V/A-type H+-transporting ATPase subunit E